MAGDLGAALAEAQAWMDDADVVAVGQSEQDGRPVVSVYVTHRAAAARFPASLHGVPVVVRDSGGEVHVQRAEDRTAPPGA